MISHCSLPGARLPNTPATPHTASILAPEVTNLELATLVRQPTFVGPAGVSTWVAPRKIAGQMIVRQDHVRITDPLTVTFVGHRDKVTLGFQNLIVRGEILQLARNLQESRSNLVSAVKERANDPDTLIADASPGSIYVAKDRDMKLIGWRIEIPELPGAALLHVRLSRFTERTGVSSYKLEVEGSSNLFTVSPNIATASKAVLADLFKKCEQAASKK